MRYTIRFLPEVEEDIIAGYAWYEEENNEIIVFGLFHCVRDPRTIRAKLRRRNETRVD